MNSITTNANSDEQLNVSQKIAENFASGPFMESTVNDLVGFLSKRILDATNDWSEENAPFDCYHHTLKPYEDKIILENFADYWTKLNLDKTSLAKKEACKKECCLSLHERVHYLTQKKLNLTASENLEITLEKHVTEKFTNQTTIYNSDMEKELYFVAKAKQDQTNSQCEESKK